MTQYAKLGLPTSCTCPAYQPPCCASSTLSAAWALCTRKPLFGRGCHKQQATWIDKVFLCVHLQYHRGAIACSGDAGCPHAR